jgi:hypothetical protein
MNTPAGPEAAYAIGDQRWARDTPGFADALAKAHENHLRPRCLCLPDQPGIDMYVARIQDGYIVKRMPNTGCQHATTCPSYEPPADFSGLGPLVGTAIVENPSTGETTLKLDFPMSKLPGRGTQPAAASAGSSVVAHGQRLGMRALLHYLWDQSELTHWNPGFAGRRTWGTVRRHLLQAAENKFVHDHALLGSLYIPEVFSVEQRDALNARRMTQWSPFINTTNQPQHLMLLIAEVKEIMPARFGYRAVVKHLPDQPFLLDEQLYRRMGRHFESVLTLWGATDDLHLVIIATFGVADAGLPTIVELSLMPVTRCWLPIESGFELHLTERMVAEGRSFVKGLRYGQSESSVIASATLTDCGESTPLLYVAQHGSHDSGHRVDMDDPQMPIWRWNPSAEGMPPLPARAARTSIPRSPPLECR